MDLQLTGKTALVSGSTAGIGLAIAKELAQEGANVTINGRTAERVQHAMEEIGAAHPKGKIGGVAADLATAAGTEVLFQQLPQVDILINNLGIFEPKEFSEISDAEWVRFFEVNVLSGVRLSRHYLPWNGSQKLGPHYFHLQRVCLANPRGNDSLRHDKNRPAGNRARVGGICCRDRRYSQQRAAGADSVRRCRRLCQRYGKSEEKPPQRKWKRNFSRRRGLPLCCSDSPPWKKWRPW